MENTPSKPSEEDLTPRQEPEAPVEEVDGIPLVEPLHDQITELLDQVGDILADERDFILQEASNADLAFDAVYAALTEKQMQGEIDDVDEFLRGRGLIE